ncbi:zinc finger protein ZFP2-like [Anopheles moucheti]|uniref:zinc finger protein ZFP2-like n=1 Tax=Anopheles moucheti TaxID=186751 RepID=UPI0022F08307|nr:zinc finger protein ZFP2-like [Anopheles moucheti]
MDILIEPDCYKVCRICMESCEDDFVCVYDEFEDVLLSEVIKECARVEIRKNDALPRNVCRNCAEYMIIAYHIIQKCRDSDITLRSIFKHELNLHREEKETDSSAVSGLRAEDMDPSGYEFLLANGYDDIMLAEEGMLLENANANCDFAPSSDKKTDDAEAFAETAIQQLLPIQPSQEEYQQKQEATAEHHTEQMKPIFANEDVALILKYDGLAMTKNNAVHESSETNEEDASVIAPEWQQKCCGCRKLFDSEQSLREHCQTVHLPVETSPSRSTINDEKPLRCLLCFKRFSSQQLLKEHQRSVNRKYTCPQCGKRFMTQENLDIHSKCHKNTETYKCCGCRMDFEQELDLLVHSQDVHRPERTFDAKKPFECDTCYRRYPTRKSLATHKRLIRQYQCQLCGAMFMKQLFLKLHVERAHSQHQAVEKLRRCCGGCKEEFKDAAALREHSERVHKPTGDGSAGSGTDDGKPFECNICRKRFASVFFLLQHQQKVYRPKCYPCTICGRTFGRAHDLSNHKTTHSNEMPFECSVCARRFKNKLYLKNHLKLHTSNAKDQVCVECGKGFRTKDLLKTHLISHSQERKYACKACPATFKRLQCLKIHTRVHTREKAFECTVCRKRYVQSSDLKRHMLTHNPGDEGKPFQCEYCLRRYPRKDYLKVHIRKQHLEKTENGQGILLQDVGLGGPLNENEIDDFMHC